MDIKRGAINERQGAYYRKYSLDLTFRTGERKLSKYLGPSPLHLKKNPGNLLRGKFGHLFTDILIDRN